MQSSESKVLLFNYKTSLQKMPTVSSAQIESIVIAAVLYLFIYTPLLLYHGRRYYRNRNHMYAYSPNYS